MKVNTERESAFFPCLLVEGVREKRWKREGGMKGWRKPGGSENNLAREGGTRLEGGYGAINGETLG